MALHCATTMLKVAIWFATGTVCLVASVSHAQPAPHIKNARIRGNVPKLIEQAEKALSRPCQDEACQHPLSPTSLFLWSPKTGRLQLTITSIDGFEQEDGSADSRPLLLRGSVGMPSQLSRSSPHDVAAVIYRDADLQSLEISVVSRHSSRRAHSRPMLFKAQLASPLANSSHVAGRIDVPSSWHRTAPSCSMTTPASLGLPHAAASERAAARLYDVLFLATDYDSSFARKIGCRTVVRCNNKILGLVHRASLLYEEPFGLVLRVARQYGPTTLTRSSDASTILGNFLDYNSAHRPDVIHDGKSASPRQVDLFQLFTGKTLDDEVFGLTYISVACRNHFSDVAALVVQHVSDSLDPTIIAHHIGHTLSATHSAGGIMKSTLEEPGATQFDQQSQDEISAHLSNYYSSCRGGKARGSLPATPTPTPTPTPDPFAGVPRSLQLKVWRPDRQHVAIQATVSEVRAGCSVLVRVSDLRGSLGAGSIVREIVPDSLVSRIARRLPAGVEQQGSRPPFVYFQAQYLCVNGETIEVSRPVRMDPNAAVSPEKLVSMARWIKLLGDTFR